jgi:hypothetical protein
MLDGELDRICGRGARQGPAWKGARRDLAVAGDLAA